MSKCQYGCRHPTPTPLASPYTHPLAKIPGTFNLSPSGE